MNRTVKAMVCIGAMSSAMSSMWGVRAHAASSLDGLLGCRALGDATARLACFDREAATLDVNALSLAPVAPQPSPPPTAATRPAAPALNPEQQFGLPERSVVSQEIAAGTRSNDAAKIEAHILRLSQGADGKTVFALDNEQVWRQLVSTGELLIRVGDPVTISRASLGSYWLQASARGCKVVRVR